ncbi:hypothetical protein GYMLUDRAFT_35782 [Collybiopsis luxurians FD-317 M1]|nr:hypothetical protein GYMLUDRAFT_35782 [Collybiopsis luxurians FD-317 M1]
MSPHFLCCLPIRLGAFFVAVVEFAISGLVAAIMWAALILNANDRIDPRLTERQEIIVGLWGASYTLLFIASIFGILGVLRKRVNWIQIFLNFLRGYLFGQTIVTIVNLVIFFVNNHDDSCLLEDQNGNCQANGLSRGGQIAVLLIFAIVPLLILAYACWILSDCVKYLIDKQVYPMTFYPFSTTGYAAVGANREEHESLTHNSGSATGRPYSHGGV